MVKLHSASEELALVRACWSCDLRRTANGQTLSPQTVLNNVSNPKPSSGQQDFAYPLSAAQIRSSVEKKEKNHAFILQIHDWIFPIKVGIVRTYH